MGSPEKRNDRMGSRWGLDPKSKPDLNKKNSHFSQGLRGRRGARGACGQRGRGWRSAATDGAPR